MTSISIVIPVLSRPANAQLVVDSIRAATTVDHEVVFMVSPDDRLQHDACAATYERVVMTTWMPGPGDFAMKINAGFKVTDGEWVFLGADDLRFHSGWDTEALRVSDGHSVIGTNDLGNPEVKRGRHATHSLVRRSYVNEYGLTWDGIPGMVYSSAYDHQYVDTELVSVSLERGVFVFAKDSVVEHLHPLWGKGVSDDTYRKGMDKGMEDRHLFHARRSQLSHRDATPWGGDAA